jgi:hypothetical protein
MMTIISVPKFRMDAPEGYSVGVFFVPEDSAKQNIAQQQMTYLPKNNVTNTNAPYHGMGVFEGQNNNINIRETAEIVKGMKDLEISEKNNNIRVGSSG